MGLVEAHLESAEFPQVLSSDYRSWAGPGGGLGSQRLGAEGLGGEGPHTRAFEVPPVA